MTDTSTPKSQSHLSIQSLRLPQNFGQTLGVKKLLTNVPVGKPRPAMFFQVHPDPAMEFKALIYEEKSARETYVVHPDLGDMMGNLARPVVLHLAVDRRGNPHLIPVVLPNEAGIRHPWHESLAQAVEAAKEEWVRIDANMSIGGYNVHAAKEKLLPPEWPEESIEQLVNTAFRGKIINSPDHPVILGLEGRQ